jgi:hypothetical protein
MQREAYEKESPKRKSLERENIQREMHRIAVEIGINALIMFRL